MKFKKIKIEKTQEVIRWRWECPECGNFNEEDAGPEYSYYIFCESCEERFKVNE